MTRVLSEYTFAFETEISDKHPPKIKTMQSPVIKAKKLKSCIVILLLLTPECELEETQGKCLEEHILLGSCCGLRKPRELNRR